MENKTVICPECSTENEPEYLFCKNCGTPLTQSEPESTHYQSAQTSYEVFDDAFSLDCFDGVPKSEMMAFVGKKSKKILQKFSYMELRQKKSSWCWPVAVLSFLFGPIGAALWFFYRKMYKTAFILVAIAILTTAAITLIDPNPLSQKELNDAVNSINFSLQQNDTDTAYNIAAKTFLPPRRLIAALLQDAVGIAVLFITSIFALYWYKNHAVKKILQYRKSDIDPRYYPIGLAAIGGVSVGMVVLGIVLLFFSTYLSSILLLFFA